jgi:mannose-1-phosphate guanylyltransferase
MIPDRQTLLLLTQTHERFYADQLADVADERLLIQPYNHGTAAAIAYSLTHVDRVDPDAVVAFFPSDHHFANDGCLCGSHGFRLCTGGNGSGTRHPPWDPAGRA